MKNQQQYDTFYKKYLKEEEEWKRKLGSAWLTGGTHPSARAHNRARRSIMELERLDESKNLIMRVEQ